MEIEVAAASLMEWLNIHASALDSAEFLGAEPTERATWLCLLRYCIGQENGGVIDGCAGWSDRKWQQLCRVTMDEVYAESALWAFEGDALKVWKYPHAHQAKAELNRKNSALGNKVKAEKRLARLQSEAPPKPKRRQALNGVDKILGGPLRKPHHQLAPHAETRTHE